MCCQPSISSWSFLRRNFDSVNNPRDMDCCSGNVGRRVTPVQRAGCLYKLNPDKLKAFVSQQRLCYTCLGAHPTCGRAGTIRTKNNPLNRDKRSRGGRAQNHLILET
ncbi:hypothetical protein EVAR_88216_1 [Eumeta japonica]|uniref:Uncharacterized protein n=1 Tax=Eumeta variegata TaxID=151549 RepID=A0A4C1Z2N2_EUMVA|nr:hypothetical protein EVAR_88216_1 [Eumeta japonica]